jgi:hypothetical protein
LAWEGQKLRGDLEELNQEATFFTNYPGWSDMLQIIKNVASISHVEGKESAARKLTVALTEWSQKWQARRSDIYGKSGVLLDRINVAEATFKMLEEEYQEVNLLRLEWLLSMSEVYPRADPSVVSTHLATTDTEIRSALLALWKKLLITLGLTEREKP